MLVFVATLLLVAKAYRCTVQSDAMVVGVANVTSPVNVTDYVNVFPITDYYVEVKVSPTFSNWIKQQIAEGSLIEDGLLDEGDVYFVGQNPIVMRSKLDPIRFGELFWHYNGSNTAVKALCTLEEGWRRAVSRDFLNKLDYHNQHGVKMGDEDEIVEPEIGVNFQLYTKAEEDRAHNRGKIALPYPSYVVGEEHSYHAGRQWIYDNMVNREFMKRGVMALGLEFVDASLQFDLDEFMASPPDANMSMALQFRFDWLEFRYGGGGVTHLDLVVAAKKVGFKKIVGLDAKHIMMATKLYYRVKVQNSVGLQNIRENIIGKHIQTGIVIIEGDDHVEDFVEQIDGATAVRMSNVSRFSLPPAALTPKILNEITDPSDALYPITWSFANGGKSLRCYVQRIEVQDLYKSDGTSLTDAAASSLLVDIRNNIAKHLLLKLGLRVKGRDNLPDEVYSQMGFKQSDLEQATEAVLLQNDGDPLQKIVFFIIVRLS